MTSAALLMVLAVFQAPVALAEQSLDRELRIPAQWRQCDLRILVAQVGRMASVPVGFEASPECRPDDGALGGWLPDGHLRADDTDTVLRPGSLHEALDAILRFAPDYAWREIGGVIVVRPKTAWMDPSDPLSIDMPEDAAAQQLGRAFESLLKRSLPEPTTGGTLLDRLNAAARRDGAGQWLVTNLRAVTAGGFTMGVVFRAGGRPDGPSAMLLTSERLLKGDPESASGR